jgi:hypothetical protein
MSIFHFSFFNIAIYIAFDFGLENDSSPMFRNPLESMFYMGVMSLGEFKDVYEKFPQIKYATLAKVLLSNHLEK